ncbi:MAG: hypothetical protein ACRD96_10405 [Bryobacteraceae bacterium]
MKRGALFAAVFALLVAARMRHAGVQWAEENLPMAAAAQMREGRMLYREAWFDKPPLLAAAYLAWGARTGWPLRLAGAAYAMLACWIAWRLGRERWGPAEGAWAAGLLAFFLTFDTHSAVVPLAADLLMLAPHLAAIHLAMTGHALGSGIAAGVAFSINVKGVFVLAACALWTRRWGQMAAGFAIPNAVAAAWLAQGGALGDYFEQVWQWGRIYASDTFVDSPVRNGIARTANWLGFHAALAAGAAWFWARGGERERWKWAAWTALALAPVAMGWRFFPRYFFQLLPVLVLVAARGVQLMGRRRAIPLLLLLIPLLRFGPRYLNLDDWRDLAMDRDSRAVALEVRRLARAGDTLLVWGFRPELFVYTGLPAATRYLDSQPLTGVAADRHLVQSEPLTPEWAAANRIDLTRSSPSIIIDGLGPYNPKLAITAYPDLAAWLAGYEVVAQTAGAVVYRRSSSRNKAPGTGLG